MRVKETLYFIGKQYKMLQKKYTKLTRSLHRRRITPAKVHRMQIAEPNLWSHQDAYR